MSTLVNAYDPDAWVEFGVAVAGAAAGLTGLIFIALSINLKRILEIQSLPGRAGESIVVFAGVLILSLTILIPGQSPEAVAAELSVGGVLLMAVLLLLALPDLRRRTRQPLSWRITRVIVGLMISVPVVIAGVSTLVRAGGGLYWLAASIAIGLAAGIANAWVLLVEVVRDERHHAVDANQHSRDEC